MLSNLQLNEDLKCKCGDFEFEPKKMSMSSVKFEAGTEDALRKRETGKAEKDRPEPKRKRTAAAHH